MNGFQSICASPGSCADALVKTSRGGKPAEARRQRHRGAHGPEEESGVAASVSALQRETLTLSRYLRLHPGALGATSRRSSTAAARPRPRRGISWRTTATGLPSSQPSFRSTERPFPGALEARTARFVLRVGNEGDPIGTRACRLPRDVHSVDRIYGVTSRMGVSCASYRCKCSNRRAAKRSSSLSPSRFLRGGFFNVSWEYDLLRTS